MEPKDVITSVAAIVGMILGVYNFVRAWADDRVRLQVTPKASSFQGFGIDGKKLYISNRNAYDLHHPTTRPDTLSVEIVNISKFAVIIDEVGLKRMWTRSRMTMINPIVPDGRPWPRKLEPRESVTVHFDATKLLDLDHIGAVRKAYASTVCGATRYGRSGALRDFIRIAAGKP